MFNEKDFGNRLREVRKTKGYTQENMLKAYGVNEISTVSRYENGEVSPTIKQVASMCNELGINISDLFKDDIASMSNRISKNPFNCNTIYMYYKGIKRTFGTPDYMRFIIDIEEKDDFVYLTLKDHKTGKIYQTGYLNSNDDIAVLDFRNYVPNQPTLSFGVVTVSIASNYNGLFKGSVTATNNVYMPTTRKCLISKDLREWDDEMKKEIEYSDEEIESLKLTNILTTNIYMKEDYEV